MFQCMQSPMYFLKIRLSIQKQSLTKKELTQTKARRVTEEGRQMTAHIPRTTLDKLVRASENFNGTSFL